DLCCGPLLCCCLGWCGVLLCDGGFWLRTGTRGLCLLAEHTQHIPNGDLVALVLDNLLQHAALFGAHFDINLVGFQFHERLAAADRIALVLEPACNHGIDYRFSQLRDTYLNGHVCLRTASQMCGAPAR